jgi:hypothetical protein
MHVILSVGLEFLWWSHWPHCSSNWFFFHSQSYQEVCMELEIKISMFNTNITFVGMIWGFHGDDTILYHVGGTWEITDSATQFQLSLFLSDFTVGSTLLSSSNARTHELSNRRLSISRTVDSRTLELSALDLSKSSLVISLLKSRVTSFSHSLKVFSRSNLQTLELSGLR